MRTTIRIDDHLMAEAKETAARTGRTLTSLIEDALRQALRSTETQPGERIPLPIHRGGRGLQPGVDLDDSAALLDLMEGRESS